MKFLKVKLIKELATKKQALFLIKKINNIIYNVKIILLFIIFQGYERYINNLL